MSQPITEGAARSETEVVTVRPPPERPPPPPQPLLVRSGRSANPSSVPAPPDETGVGLSWAFICDVAPVSRAVHFRALVQLLGALSTLHTDVSKAPVDRCYGVVCASNLMVRSDGSVLLVRDRNSLFPQPAVYRAPELARPPAIADQQADLYAVSVMLLEAILGRPVRRDEVTGLQTIEPHVHAYFRQYAADPLLALARRGLAVTPSQRWVSARAFADAIVHVGGQRVASTADLQHLVQVTLARQAERLTPVHPAPEALSLPMALAAPASQSLTSKANAPSYVPPASVGGSDARHAAHREHLAEHGEPEEFDRASAAVSIEPYGLFTLAKAPRPASRAGLRWAAGALLVLGAAAWGVANLVGSSADESVVAQAPSLEPAPPVASTPEALRPLEAVQTDPKNVEGSSSHPALGLRSTAPTREAKDPPKREPRAAQTPRTSATQSPAAKKDAKRPERSTVSSAPASSPPSQRAPASVGSDYDPDGI